jgi:glutamine synthetase
MDIGVDVLPRFPKDNTDRNRTSPFAFTGNKFEFRRVGSSLSIAGPLFILNAIVADVLQEFADHLEAAEDFNQALGALIQKTILDHERIIFNGNNYSDEWVVEAERRGLLNLKTATDALPCFSTPENIALLERQGVLNEIEVKSRLELLLEGYIKILHIEAQSALNLVHRGIAPAVIAYSADVAKAVKLKSEAGLTGTSLESNLLRKISALSDTLDKDMEKLEKSLLEAEEKKDTLAMAKYYGKEVNGAMSALRVTVDALENIVDKGYWPLPGYGEILYSVR